MFEETFSRNMQEQKLSGRFLSKMTLKKCIPFTTFGDCKFAEHCRYNHEGNNTHIIIKLKDIMKQVDTLSSEIIIRNYLKVANVEKENKLKDIIKIREENY